MMVKLAREAGTMIRKEAIKRQALTAEVNLEYAKSLRKLIQEDYELLCKPLEDVLKEHVNKLKKGMKAENIVGDWLISSLLTALQASLIRPIPEMAKHIEDVNTFLNSVINQIINEVSKEGIYLHSIEAVSLPLQVDVIAAYRGLKDALTKMGMAIGILRGLTEASS